MSGESPTDESDGPEPETDAGYAPDSPSLIATSTRRGFLRAGGIAAAATLAGGTGAAYAGRARPEQIVTPEEHLPERVSARKRAVVVGGGLAGLSAAIELAERGVEVELFEAGDSCGGRVGGYRARVLGEELTLEHGFHGFFFQYYNLRDLIARTGDPSDYLAVDAYPLAYRGLPVDVLHANRYPFPFNMLNVLVESTNLDLVTMMKASTAHIWDMLSYDPVATFEALDHLSFHEWAREREVAPLLYDCFYDPYASTMFMRPDELSAAEMIQLFHGYFIANPEGMGMDVLRRPSPLSLIDPLVEALRALGGTVHTSSPIHALDIDGDGQVVGVVQRTAGEPRQIGSVPVDQIPEQGYVKVPTELGGAFIRRNEAGFTALDVRCTHQGCPVDIDARRGGFLCPCHGGRYDATGSPVAGPPRRPLAPVEATARAGEVVLTTRVASRNRRIPADYVILATDVAGTRAIATRTQWPSSAARWVERLDALRIAPPYSVARQWVDRPVRPDRHPLYTGGGYEALDEVFLYSQFEEPAREWARQNRGTVLETHCYAVDPAHAADPERLHAIALEETGEIIPELRGARVLHREVQLLENFSAYGVGGFASRPGTATPFPNLHLAGDFVRIDLPLELMERATVSGRLAANLVLEREGVRRVGIRTPPRRGILA